jgi:poly-gamma-glutamate synthesis protein (capsule biosynthesis protein)
MPTTLALLGDVMLGRGVSAELADRPPQSFWGNVLPHLQSADAIIANLECALTPRTDPWQKIAKGFHFRADPHAVEILRAARIGCVSLANNHTMDFGEEGLLDTLRCLERAGIQHAGAGSNLAEAEEPTIIDVAGLKVGIIAFTDHDAASAAGPTSPGTNFVEIATETATRARVARAADLARKAGAEFVILSLHWGPNMRLAPSPLFREFAHAAVEDGVNLIYGHSAHTFQGVELYQKGLILYDTGDFLDDYAVDPMLRYDWSVLFLVSIDAAGLKSLRLIPVRQDYAQPNLGVGRDFEAIVERMRRQCAQLGTTVASTPEGLQIHPSANGAVHAEVRRRREQPESATNGHVTASSTAITDGPLARLLDPVDLGTFKSTYWERASLYIPGTSEKFADLFSRSEFFRAAKRISRQVRQGFLGDNVILYAGLKGADGNHHQMLIEADQIRPVLAAGMTIQAELLDISNSALGILARSVREQFRIPVDVDVAAFLSPDTGGYPLHYDRVAMWVLQIAGAKRWWYSPAPVVPFPLVNRIPTAQQREQGVDGLYRDEDLQEQLLSPGDVLYLPAGAWHRVRAEGESLHLCLTIRYTHYLQLISDMLSPALLARTEWRHLPMPPAVPGDLEKMDPCLEEQFCQRLQELRTAVAALTPMDVFRAWRDRALTV